MDTIRKLKNRKGFTMVELIIVIAIIGVLLAMILPSLMSSNKDTQGKGFAKEFYYKTQDFMSRRKLADDVANPAIDAAITDDHAIFYAQFSRGGDLKETGIIKYQNGGSYAASDLTSRTAIDSSSAFFASFKELMSKFESEVESYITSTDYDCTFYALVDSNYRVQAAYWTDGAWSDIVSGNGALEYTDDCITGDYYSCSYPAELCRSGKKMFVY